MQSNSDFVTRGEFYKLVGQLIEVKTNFKNHLDELSEIKADVKVLLARNSEKQGEISGIKNSWKFFVSAITICLSIVSIVITLTLREPISSYIYSLNNTRYAQKPYYAHWDNNNGKL